MLKYEVIVSAEFHTHQSLWLHAILMEDLRVKNKDEGAHVAIEEALSCSMLLNIAFAVEAHTNYLLEIACPAEYKNERETFSQDPYKGPLGKLEFLAKRLNMPLDKGCRPFQTIRQLFKWRDMMVHGRKECYETTIKCDDLNQISLPEPEGINAYKTSWANCAIEDSKKLCSSLQGSAYSDKTVKGVLSPEAFSGFLGSRGTETIFSES